MGLIKNSPKIVEQIDLLENVSVHDSACIQSRKCHIISPLSKHFCDKADGRMSTFDNNLNIDRRFPNPSHMKLFCNEEHTSLIIETYSKFHTRFHVIYLVNIFHVIFRQQYLIKRRFRSKTCVLLSLNRPNHNTQMM